MQVFLEEANGNIDGQRFNKKDQSHNVFSSEQGQQSHAPCFLHLN